MDQPFLAMLMMFAGNFAPRGWSFCGGQIMAISQNTALFSLLGTTFGGNGQTTFALPDLRGRFPLGTGQGAGLPNIILGEMSGTPTTTLNITHMPGHNHAAAPTLTVAQSASTAAGTTNVPGSGLVPAVLPTIGSGPGGTTIKGYAPQDNTATLASSTVSGGVTIGITGGSQPFSIMNPYLGMNYCIALQGIFPSRN